MRPQKGVTLIELMITVAIVAILAAIAYPSYQQQILRSNRSDGKAALLRASQALEKCYTTSGKYTDCLTLPFDSENKLYSIDEGAAKVKDSDFEITATAKGTQANDDACASLSLTDTNTRTAKTKGGADNSAVCWK